LNKTNQQNETLKLINNRRTIRAYNPKPLTQEDINAIIHGAIRAPTAGNMMFYSIIQVIDQKTKEKLAITCDHQPHISKAPLVLIFLADMQRWWDYFEFSKTQDLCNEIGTGFETPQESDLLLACCDALIAAQNAVITAEALGIGSCYIGDIMENIEIHRELLNLPKWVFPFIHFIDKYKRLNENDFTEMFRGVKRDYNIKYAKNLGQKFYFGKLVADFAIEMRRSVKVAINEWNSKKKE
jgi:FMN reductase (NADPH)